MGAAPISFAHPGTREIGSEGQLLAAYRYLARNPVEAGLVADPLHWPFGSARAHAGLERPQIPLAENELRAAFAGHRKWRREYVACVRAEDEDRVLEAAGAGNAPGIPPNGSNREISPPAFPARLTNQSAGE
jgi:hypothetical protein